MQYVIKYEFFGTAQSDYDIQEFNVSIELDEIAALKRARLKAKAHRSKELSEEWSIEFLSMTIND